MTVAQQGNFEEAREARPFEAEFRSEFHYPADLPPKSRNICSNNVPLMPLAVRPQQPG